MKLAWPWDVADAEAKAATFEESFREEVRAHGVNRLRLKESERQVEQAESHARAAQTQRAQTEAECVMLRKQMLGLQAEIEALKSPPPKPPLHPCPSCGSVSYYAIRAIVGWREGAPDPSGGTTQCIRCGNHFHVIGDKIELAKPLQAKATNQDKPRPRPKDDSDLRFNPED